MFKEISTSRLAELLRKERKLDLLESYGVDDWEEYSDAIDDKLGMEDISYTGMLNLSDEYITDNYKTLH